MRLMIVDDQEIMRLGLSLILSEHDEFEVVAEAEDVDDSVEKTKLLTPDVVLMDIGLRTGSGIDAVLQIKEAVPSTRIVMFTSHESDEEIFAALSVGAEGYCLKSVSSRSLTYAIKAVATGAIWLDPAIASKVLRLHSKNMQASQYLPRPSEQPAAETANKFALSQRELEVLTLLTHGLTNTQIAQHLTIGPETVKTHVRHIMEKLATPDRTQAAVKAVRSGLL